MSWNYDTLVNRFDLYGALYMFCVEYHSGQWSRGYRILSRLTKAQYHPSREVEDCIPENQQMEDYYHQLVANYGSEV